ncbi:MAG TPA: MOSC domain-containing protein [Amaricoccus sp.]|uniref:MOSC domain-containing protein n=1 Tax=Amaricoccus sp. TaxID=1872485 RepID=UPI002CA56C03|nr:MOSC domain-containing protein [Amaricoccus sp.]HMQ92377.1 MOSC domain-containing protein [Amaricoccus sp.]HMR51631.1 MOSC domain-containing protein [Amaricoccus sp.]HMR60149.1 MOSC domain-containing protein [Amaricoccus sp.]HMT98433.1 MOSC domain-containing protein [Amaricoccus sp.]
MNWKIDAVRLGRIAPLGPAGVPSGIDKQPATGPVALTGTGLEGDEHGDTRHHGGTEKAVHLYPQDHYADWRSELPGLAERFVAGGFGENLVVGGITEADVCIGDLFRAGSALVELSQGRQPCWRLNLRFGLGDMARRVQDSGRTGWYFRVIEPGEIAAGADLALVRRPHPSWTLARVHRLLYRETLDLEALAEFALLPSLSPSWQELARRRLERRSVESWDRRVTTPE